VARKRNVTLVHMTTNKMLGAHGFLARLFNVFEELKISVDLIATSEVSVTVTVDEKHDIEELQRRLLDMARVEIVDGQCIIAIVGRNLLTDSRVGIRVFEALRDIPMQMLSLGRSGLNLSIVVDDGASDRAIQRIHHALFEQAVAV
jgi:aspartate kinase